MFVNMTERSLETLGCWARDLYWRASFWHSVGVSIAGEAPQNDSFDVETLRKCTRNNPVPYFDSNYRRTAQYRQLADGRVVGLRVPAAVLWRSRPGNASIQVDEQIPHWSVVLE